MALLEATVSLRLCVLAALPAGLGYLSDGKGRRSGVRARQVPQLLALGLGGTGVRTAPDGFQGQDTLISPSLGMVPLSMSPGKRRTSPSTCRGVLTHRFPRLLLVSGKTAHF